MNTINTINITSIKHIAIAETIVNAVYTRGKNTIPAAEKLNVIIFLKNQS